MTSRRVARLAVAISFLTSASVGAAATLPFTGELSIEIYPQAPLYFTIPSSGTIDVNPLGGVHLTQASVAAGAFATQGQVRNLSSANPLAPILGAVLTASNAAGAFAGSAGGPFGGAMPLQGAMKLCLFGACSAAAANISLPITPIGEGGAAFAGGVVSLTVVGAPWTTGTAQIGTVSVQGSARGPAALPSSTAQLGGSLNLVSPIFISSNLGDAPVIPAFSRLHLLFGGTPECSDGVDNDGDGLTDYPADPGCLGADDLSEHQIGVACDDGIDNDGDGLIDYPADPGCSSPAGLEEHPCSDDLVSGPPNIGPLPPAPAFLDLGIPASGANAVSANGAVVVGTYRCGAYRWTTVDGVGWIGSPGDSASASDVSADGTVIVGSFSDGIHFGEAFLWTPSDGMTNLGTLPDEGFRDSFAEGTSADGSTVVGEAYQPVLHIHEAVRWTSAAGIEGLGFLPDTTNSEATGVSGDGTIIVGSSSRPGSHEAFVWQAGSGMVGIGALGPLTDMHSLANAISEDGATVVGSAQKVDGGYEKPYRWSPTEGMTELSLASGLGGSAFAVSKDGAVILGVDHGATGDSYVLWDRLGNRSSLFQASSPAAPGGAFARWGLDVSQWQELRIGGMSDDGHVVTGWGYLDDSSMRSWLAVIPLCDDGIDDDGDGLVDFPADPGCDSATDLSEKSDGAICDNGIDDDGDGKIDFPDDPGCSSPADATEEFGTTACDDGADNDGDTLVDFPADPGCESFADDSELSAIACDDGIDNDGDGLVDHADPGCESPTDPSEKSACEDGIDNDGDGLTDYPADPGCESPSDLSERSAALVCDDGLDNDGDGLIDFPADPTCSRPTSLTEASQCNDGLDNDHDGFVDFPADPGCASPASAREYAMCQDGIDNQGDGTVDFDGGASVNGGVPLGPPDPKCVHPYDNRETPSCGLGAELAVALGALGRWRRRLRATGD